MAQSEDERRLYEYQRQLKAPKVFKEKYPYMSDAVSPDIAHLSEQEVYNKLGSRVGESPNPGALLRQAETLASSAVAKDYYKSRDFKEILNKIKKEKGLTFDTQEDSNTKDSGLYFPSEDKLVIKPTDVYGDIDTAVHEAGHASDYATDPKKMNKLSRSEDMHMGMAPSNFINTPDDPSGTDTFQKGLARGREQVAAFKDRDLYKLSELINTGHFLEPRSHSVNTLIEKAKELAEKEGVVGRGGVAPDENPTYDRFKVIKPTLKTLENYPQPQSGAFEKLKKYLGR